jgi:FkbM family methyltransferase
MRRRGGLGWIPWGAGTREEKFWQNLPLNGLIVYDIGAFQGLLTLFFASKCAQVVAYEPNDVNRQRLLANIQLNNLTNVCVRKLAVGSHAESGTLAYQPSMAGGGAVNGTVAGSVSQPVEITTLDSDIAAASLPPPDLIKIDIEGWELAALEGARATLEAHHPALFLEMHGETMREKRGKVAAIVAFLCDAGYTDILHVESGAAITPDEAGMAAEGHLYCLCPTNISLPMSKARSAS